MIKDLVMKNRTYRRFNQKEGIKKQQLLEWVDLARMTSSGQNNQPLKYYLSCEKESNQLIFPHLKWAGALKDWDGPSEGEKPTAYIVMLADTKISNHYWWDHGLAAQTILLAATEAGYGGCMFGSVDRKSLAKEIDLPQQYEIIMVIALGKPVENVVMVPVEESGDMKYYRDQEGNHYVPKRSLEEIVLNK
ncbi:Nitroreductase [Tindallia magadiensis]|uniref:Nitroreductase n=1 Tax=Tindallia magadiensis TaxID=69895 RepID=A0A1I3DME3_9FIRM|nr:nitroreductase family protein [Tindallia magadiensis]SFH87904.1 Nitroreductase [Tindallia magadiensis]